MRAGSALFADIDLRRMLSTPPHGRIILKKGIIIFRGGEMVLLEDFEP